jgi:hypothetical protein
VGQFGSLLATGLVHDEQYTGGVCPQELYGNAAAGRLLSCLSRLFTAFLQDHGFTCGLDDVALVHAAELERTRTLGKAEAKVQAGWGGGGREKRRGRRAFLMLRRKK